VSRSIDPRGNITGYVYSYNSDGLLTMRIDHPGPRGHERITYDLLGRVSATRDGNGRLTSYGWDGWTAWCAPSPPRASS
jgi:hypothetical protein